MQRKIVLKVDFICDLEETVTSSGCNIGAIIKSMLVEITLFPLL